MNITSISLAESFRLEEYTDDKAGAIIRMIPVLPNGIQDPMRPERFTGKTYAQTNRGPIEIRFAISASSLSEAFDKWAAAFVEHMNSMNEAAQTERVRSSIINGAKVSPMEARQLKKLKQ